MQGAEAAPEPVDWKRSMTRHTITCMECGAAFKQLSVRHLRDHDLEPRAYRVKYGILRTQPLAAKDTTAMRKRIVQQTRPWEKAPRAFSSRVIRVEGLGKTRDEICKASTSLLG
jgi:predicted transcriptional regulator